MGRSESLERTAGQLAGSLALLVATAVPAYGESPGSTKDVTELNASADIVYDSNAARAEASNAQLRGLKVSDEHATLGAEVVVKRGLGRNTLEVHGFAGYDFYRRNKDLNRERLALRGDVGLNAGPCLVRLQPSIERHQSDLGKIAVLNLNTIESVKNTETVQIYGGDIRCGSRYGIRPIGRYERTIADNSSEIRKISNYRRDIYGGGIAFDHPVIGNYTVTYGHQTVRYPDRAGTLLAGISDYHTDEARLRGERKIGAIVTASGSVAYQWLRPQGNQVPGFDGVVWNLAVTVTPVPRLQVRLATEHQASPSFGAEALYSLDHSYEATASFALTSRTLLEGGVAFERRRFIGSQAIFGPLLEHDRIFRGHGGVSYALSRRVKFTLEAGYERRNANSLIYDYDNTFVALKTRVAL